MDVAELDAKIVSEFEAADVAMVDIAGDPVVWASQDRIWSRGRFADITGHELRVHVVTGLCVTRPYRCRKDGTYNWDKILDAARTRHMNDAAREESREWQRQSDDRVAAVERLVYHGVSILPGVTIEDTEDGQWGDSGLVITRPDGRQYGMTITEL